MKIAIIHSHFELLVGSFKFSIKLVNTLAKMGHEAYLFTKTYKPGSYLPLNDSVNLIEVGGPKRHSSIFWLTLPFYCKVMKKEIDSHGPFDFVISDTFPENYIASTLKTARKTIFYCHEPYRPFHDTEYIKNATQFNKVVFKILKILYNALDIKGTRAQDVIMCNSTNIRRQVKGVYGRIPILNPPGLFKEIFFPTDKNLIREKWNIGKRPLLFTLGFSHFHKGMKELLILFKRVLNKVPEAILLIGGNITEYNRNILSSLKKALSIPDSSIIISGFIPELELNKYYSAADVFLYTPLNEPFGKPPVEAMACGTPTIAFSGGPEDSIVNGETGFIVQSGNINDYVEKVILLLKDDVLRENMGKKGIERINRFFTW
ncbi:MAG: glycosyltransferase family 4 protein, partial [Promethearchaeota archaeon]